MSLPIPVLPAHSLLEFARCSISAQIDIAVKVRDIQNDTYILFDRSFETVRTVRVGDFRVQVDDVDRRAVLSVAAQSAFSFYDYLYFAQDIARDLIYTVGRVVFLRRANIERAPFDRLHLHPLAPSIIPTLPEQSDVIDRVIADLNGLRCNALSPDLSTYDKSPVTDMAHDPNIDSDSG